MGQSRSLCQCLPSPSKRAGRNEDRDPAIEESSESEETNKLHVAVLTFPDGENTYFLLMLTIKLATTLPDVAFSVLCVGNYVDHYTKRLNTDIPSNVKIHDIYPRCRYIGMCRRIQLIALENFNNFALDRYNTILSELHESLKITHALCDPFLWFLHQIEVIKMVRLIMVWTGGFSSLAGYCNAENNEGLTVSRLDTYLMPEDFESFQFDDTELTEQPFESIGGYELVIWHNMQQVDTVVINSMEELEPSFMDAVRNQLQGIRWFTVAPDIIREFSTDRNLGDDDDDDDMNEWLAGFQPGSVIFISFTPAEGHLPLKRIELDSLAMILEAMKIPFVWVIARNFKKLLPVKCVEAATNDGLGRVIQQTQRTKYLKNPAFGFFVTNCDWITMLDAIYSEVPMICRPRRNEQMNARLIMEEWRIGVKLYEEVYNIESWINVLSMMGTDAWIEMKQNISKLKAIMTSGFDEETGCTKDFQILLDIFSSPNSSN